MYQQALTHFQNVGDRYGLGSTLNNLGIIYQEQGAYMQAEEMYQQALILKQEMGDRHGEGAISNNLGLLYREQGAYIQAEEMYQQALTLKQEMGDRYGLGSTLNNLGIIYQEQGAYTQAEEMYQQALILARQIGDQQGEGATLNNLGSFYCSQERYEQAQQAYEQALKIHQELQLSNFMLEDWAGLSYLALENNQLNTALSLIHKILNSLNESSYLKGSDSRFRTFYFIWQSLQALGMVEEAKQILMIAIQFIQDYLSKETDPDRQNLYLSQPHHKKLWLAWQAQQDRE